MKYTCQVHVSLVNFLTDPNETLNEEVFIWSLWICFTYLAGENNPQFQAESCTAQTDYKIDSTFKLMVTFISVVRFHTYIERYILEDLGWERGQNTWAFSG